MITVIGAASQSVRARGIGRAIARAGSLAPADWRSLIEAQRLLLAAQLLVWRRPVGQLVTDVVDDQPQHPPSPPSSPMWSVAHRSAVAIRRAADHGVFRPRCLVRSIALSRMLESRGIRGSEIRIGVQAGGGRFAAHAWVELAGRVIGDEPRHTRSFVQISTLRVV